METEFIFLRHAEAVIDDAISNDLLPLSANGVKQAKKVKRLLKGKFDAVYCSTSKRAIDTAKIVAENEPIQDKRLLERGWGNEKSDGKETNSEAKTRFEEFLKETLPKHKGKRILIVSHGALIKLAQDVVEGQCHAPEQVEHCQVIKCILNNSIK